MLVKTIDMKLIDKLIQQIDPELQNYIRCLKDIIEVEKDLRNKATSKLRELSETVSKLKDSLAVY
jgi:hypothetical protein